MGLFSIGLDTYWPQFEGLLDRLMDNHREIGHRILQNDVSLVDAGMIDNSAKVKAAIDRLQQDRVDLLFLNIATFGLSKLMLPVVRELGLPVIVLNLQPSEAMDYEAINILGDRGKIFPKVEPVPATVETRSPSK